MKINTANLVALLLAVAGIVLLIRYRHALGAFLMNLERIGPGHSPEEQTMGLIALALIGICIVAIVKILTRNRGD